MRSRKLICLMILVGLRLSLPTLPAFAGLNQWTTNGPPGTAITALVSSSDFTTYQTIFGASYGYGVIKSTNGGLSWSPANNGLTSTEIFSLAISPANDQVIFAGALNGEVFRSTDGGLNWSPVKISQTYNTVQALAISPTNDQIIFAGTRAGFAGAVFKSTDGGQSWNPASSGLTGTEIFSLAISPNFAADRTIFAGAADGVFKSTDEGQNWFPLNTNLPYEPTSLAISPDFAADQTIFVGTGYGVFKSINGGQSWGAANSGLTDTIIADLAISPNFAADQTIFAGTWNGSAGVFRSTNGGLNWSAVSTSLITTSIHDLTIPPNFNTDQTIFAGTAGAGVISYTFALPMGNGQTVIVSVPGGYQLSSVSANPNPVGSQGISLPDGTVSYIITGVSPPGDNAVSWLTFSTALPNPVTIYKWDGVILKEIPQSGDPDGSWTLSPDRKVLALTLKDGGDFDLDHTENGVIVDPIGFGGPTPATGINNNIAVLMALLFICGGLAVIKYRLTLI